MLLTLLLGLAWAGPPQALGATFEASTADVAAGALTWRTRFADGLQFGLSFRAAGIRTAFLDGWPIRAGQTYTGTVDLGLPLVKRQTVQIDLEVELGARGVLATDTDAPDDRSWLLIADVRPMATVRAHELAAVRLGWTHVLHQQIGPRYGLEAQGVVPRVEVVTAPTEHLQVVVGGDVGGIFGFNGDGGKFLAGGRLALVWVPGAARTWMNH